MTWLLILAVALISWGLAKWDAYHWLSWRGRWGAWRCLWLVDVLHVAHHVPWEHPCLGGNTNTHCDYCKRILPRAARSPSQETP
jgi:hypothetical protein